jgi:hypothetical protein
MDQLSLLSHMASGYSQAILGGAAVSAVLCLEVPRRVAGIRVETLGIKQCARSCVRIVCGCAPEVMGLSVVLLLALMLRLRGDTDVNTDPASQQVWEQIKVEWPILMGADTLLNLQAMLRLLVLLFVSMRAQAGGRSPLTGLPALLFLAAAVTRGMMGSQTDAYRLEGPLSLGGDLAVACEVAGVAFWAALGRRAISKAPVSAAVMVSGAIWFASHHYLSLARDASKDRLFIQAHVLELLAAFAYATRSFSLMLGASDEDGEDDRGSPSPKRDWRSNAFVGFMHMVLTLQQAFSAYYFLTAFDPHPNLVGAGRPFCVLCIGNLFQLGAFLCAAAFWAGGCALQTEEEGTRPAQQADTVVIQDDVLEDKAGSPTTTEPEEGSSTELDSQLEAADAEAEDAMDASVIVQ